MKISLKAKDQKHGRNKEYCVGLLNLAQLDPGFLQLGSSI